MLLVRHLATSSFLKILGNGRTKLCSFSPPSSCNWTTFSVRLRMLWFPSAWRSRKRPESNKCEDNRDEGTGPARLRLWCLWCLACNDPAGRFRGADHGQGHRQRPEEFFGWQLTIVGSSTGMLDCVSWTTRHLFGVLKELL